MRRKSGLNRYSAGFGLVEILIAMLLGLILTIGMTNVFLSSKQAYRTQSALSVVQENGRYAMETLTRGIRMAGFQGCASLDIVVPNVIAQNVSGFGGFSSSEAIRGYAFSGGKFYSTSAGSASDKYGSAASTADDPVGVLDGTDVITVQRADDCDAYLVGNMLVDNANIQINPDNTCDFGKNDLVLITDCSSSDLFSISSNPIGTGKITMAHAKGVNTTNRLSKPYGEDAQIFKYVHSDYYVKNNAFGEPALYRRDFVKGAYVESELVEGVEDMQIIYGEDTTADFSADQYVQESELSEIQNEAERQYEICEEFLQAHSCIDS